MVPLEAGRKRDHSYLPLSVQVQPQHRTRHQLGSRNHQNCLSCLSLLIPFSLAASLPDTCRFFPDSFHLENSPDSLFLLPRMWNFPRPGMRRCQREHCLQGQGCRRQRGAETRKNDKFQIRLCSWDLHGSGSMKSSGEVYGTLYLGEKHRPPQCHPWRPPVLTPGKHIWPVSSSSVPQPNGSSFCCTEGRRCQTHTQQLTTTSSCTCPPEILIALGLCSISPQSSSSRWHPSQVGTLAKLNPLAGR